MIRVGFVNKMFVVGQDGDYFGFGVFYQMRKYQLLVVGQSDVGYWCSGQWVVQGSVELVVDGFVKFDFFVLIVWWCGGEMVVIFCSVRYYLCQLLVIVGKIVVGQYYGVSFDVNFFVVVVQYCVGYVWWILQQLDYWGIELKMYVGVEGGLQQMGDQCIVIDQMLFLFGVQLLLVVVQQVVGSIQCGVW